MTQITNISSSKNELYYNESTELNGTFTGSIVKSHWFVGWNPEISHEATFNTDVNFRQKNGSTTAPTAAIFTRRPKEGVFGNTALAVEEATENFAPNGDFATGDFTNWTMWLSLPSGCIRDVRTSGFNSTYAAYLFTPGTRAEQHTLGIMTDYNMSVSTGEFVSFQFKFKGFQPNYTYIMRQDAPNYMINYVMTYRELGDGWTLATYTWESDFNGNVSFMISIRGQIGDPDKEVYLDEIQYEKKRWATSFTSTSRASNQSVIYPVSLIPDTGTVAFWWRPTLLRAEWLGVENQAEYPQVMHIGNYYQNNSLVLWLWNKRLRIFVKGSTVATWSCTGSVGADITNTDDWHHIAISWHNKERFTCFLNGVKKQDRIIDDPMGTWTNGIRLIGSAAYPTNSLYDNIIITNQFLDSDYVPPHEILPTNSGSVDYVTIKSSSNETNGEKNLFFRIEDNNGGWDTDELTVELFNTVPTANANGPYTVNQKETVILDGTGSTDIDGTVEKYYWYLVVNETQHLIVETTETTVEVEHQTLLDIADWQGTYPVRLIVEDNDGDVSDPDETTLTITMPKLPYGIKWYNNIQIADGPRKDAGIDMVKNFKRSMNQLKDLSLFREFPDWKENKNNWELVSDGLNDRIGIYLSQTNNVIDTFEELAGSNKWFGGTLAPNGKIYCSPRSSTSVLAINTHNDSVELFGDVAEMIACGVLAPNGKIYCPPTSGDYILKIDPETHTTTEITGVENTSYFDGILANNGKIYFTPSNAEHILILDPTDDSFVEISDPALEGGMWTGSVLGANGCIYCVPYTTSYVLKIDPVDNSMSLIGEDYGTGDLQKWFGGAVGPNGLIYGIPYEGTAILKINPYKDTTHLVSSFGDERKWLGGVLAPNGLIYGIPSNTGNVLVFNPLTESVREIGDFGDQTLKWTGGILGANGAIYGIPRNSEQVLKIGTGFKEMEMDFVLSRYWNKM